MLTQLHKIEFLYVQAKRSVCRPSSVWEENVEKTFCHRDYMAPFYIHELGSRPSVEGEGDRQ